jgi:hypothetical protein
VSLAPPQGGDSPSVPQRTDLVVLSRAVLDHLRDAEEPHPEAEAASGARGLPAHLEVVGSEERHRDVVVLSHDPAEESIAEVFQVAVFEAPRRQLSLGPLRLLLLLGDEDEPEAPQGGGELVPRDSVRSAQRDRVLKSPT